jgi:putative ABC transport system permease protein
LLLLARKNLFSERIRLAISVGGVALSVFLIGVLLSLYRGWDEKVGGFVEDSDVDVWVGSEGTNDFLAAASLIPLENAGEVGDQPEIDEWSAVIVRPMQGLAVKVDDGEDTSEQEVNIHLIGYDPATNMSGPIKIVEGEGEPGTGEVIIDEALKDRAGIGVGDELEAAGRRLKVVGVASGGDFVASQAVFVSLAEAQDLLRMEEKATFIGIRVADNVDPQAVADEIPLKAQGITAFTRDEFTERTRDRILGNILPILTMVLGLAFIVGLAVSGLTIYTATVEKAREYGILKAVGFKNGYLYRLVFEQSLATGAIGFIIGAALTLLFSPLAGDFVPQFVTLVRWQDMLVVLGATVVMSLIAGYIPVRRLATIDPTTVFKA